MNSEQLISARLARWSQNGEARLTLEAVADWMNAVGICCYLPLRSIPAPSFVEAVVGRPAPIPSVGEQSRANELLSRLAKNAAAIPLKLNANAFAGHPDFIASPETLRYVYALRGDRNFKGSPSIVGSHKVTPLALHCWQKISENGPLNLGELQSLLGGDITGAAITRALHELWAALYIFPTPEAGDISPKWDLLYRSFPQQASAGSSTGHAEALSAMVSLYLQEVVAAPEEDVFSILSSLASQSKLREVVRALGAMRQLDMLDIGGRPHLCLQGSFLPEIAAQIPSNLFVESPIDEENQVKPSRQIENAPDRSRSTPDRVKKFSPKTFPPRKFSARNSERRQFSSPPRHESGKRAEFSRAPQFRPRDSGRPQGDGRDRPEDKNDRGFKNEQRLKNEPRPKNEPRFGKRFSGPPDKNRRGGSWDESKKRTERKSYGDRNFSNRMSKSREGPKENSKPWMRKGDSGKRFDAPKRYRDSESNSSAPEKAGETRESWKKPKFGPRSGGDSRNPKPWKKKISSRNDSGRKSDRPGDRQNRADAGSNKKFGAKPFRKKSFGGGKGSPAASRTNRPRRSNGGKNR